MISHLPQSAVLCNFLQGDLMGLASSLVVATDIVQQSVNLSL